MNKKILIIGAKSDIALAVARKFAENGFDLALAARNSHDLESTSSDLEIRYGTKVTRHDLNILDYDSFDNFINSFDELPEVVFCSVGYLGSQKNDEQDIPNSSLVIKTNFEGPSLFLGNIANHFEKRKFGTIIGVSSVAGERGRKSNYIYGSAKSGFTTFLSGLRNRLSSKNVNVMTVKPGFVKTKMIDGIYTPKMLTAQPFHIANYIFKGYKKRSDEIFYLGIWKYIMLAIKLLPETFFKKTDL